VNHLLVTDLYFDPIDLSLSGNMIPILFTNFFLGLRELRKLRGFRELRELRILRGFRELRKLRRFGELIKLRGFRELSVFSEFWDCIYDLSFTSQ